MTEIEIGTLWTRTERSPWDAFPVEVKILDVKSGWVKYQIRSKAGTSSDRARAAEFLKLYKPVEIDWPAEIEV